MPNIVYEDNQVIVAVKPPNMLSQADKTGDTDILTVLKEYVKEKYNKPGRVYLGLVHRLDRPVGGVMAFARTSKAASRLSEQFSGHAPNYMEVLVRGGAELHNTVKNVRITHTDGQSLFGEITEEQE